MSESLQVKTLVDYMAGDPRITDENSLDIACEAEVRTYTIDFCLKIICEDCRGEPTGFAGSVEELFEGGYEATAQRLRELAAEALWGMVMVKDNKNQEGVE